MYRSFQALLLVGLAIFLVDKVISGRLSWYINLRFLPLTLLGILLLGVMAQTLFRLQRREAADDHDHDHGHAAPAGNLLILLIPLAIGVLIPAQPLDSTAVDSKGVSLSAPLVASGASAQQLQVAADERNILDWIRIFNYESDPTPYLDQPANVIGFVYHDERLPEDQFLLSRFVISCCAADGFALGIPVQWSGAQLEDNTWVQVRGPVQVAEFEGQQVPLIAADSVETVPAPQQPYLVP
jgi:uncharacterized repeat protein (TIGR03943 family)